MNVPSKRNNYNFPISNKEIDLYVSIYVTRNPQAQTSQYSNLPIFCGRITLILYMLLFIVEIMFTNSFYDGMYFILHSLSEDNNIWWICLQKNNSKH
jgi:hypothetical protein